MNAKISVATLKEKLRYMNLSTTGVKAELMNRLLEAGVTESDLLEDDLTEEAVVRPSEENATIPIEAVRAEHSVQPLLMERTHATSVGHSTQSQITERELLLREKELAEREVRLLRRELEIMRLSGHGTEGSRPSTSSTVVSWRDAKETISDYDGSSNCDRWRRQAEKFIQTYALDEYTAKAFVCSKLKDKALKWYHAQEDCVDLSYTELLERLQKMFGHRSSSLELRHECEKRTWQVGELFADYLHDKIILAGRVPLQEHEIVEYIVYGIPDVNLRDQARMQRFESTDQILSAFERISLSREPMRRKTTPQAGNATNVKTSA